jgi:cation:H+ antiporter
MYSGAVAIALIPPLRDLKGILGWVFLPTYVLYLFLVLRTPTTSATDIEEAAEAREAFDALSFAAYLRRAGARLDPHRPPKWLVVGQTLLAFGGILLGAKIFAAWIDAFSHAMGFNALLVALLLAPLATELPEAANSLIWTKDGKDVIALGNVAGAMVFQSTVPVTVGVLLTPWILGPFGTVAAIFALVSGALIFVQLRFRTIGDALPLSSLVVGGSLYVVFIAYVLKSVIAG